MPQKGRDRRSWSRLLAAAACALAPIAARAADSQASAAANRATARALVSRAAVLAARKLSRPECRELLTDFHEASGRTLVEVLEVRGRSVLEFFGSLTFLDGRSVPQCATGRVAAGATVGSPFIAICRGTFVRTQSDDPGLAANVLIHEMLHALGLSEAPLTPDAPTSEEITRQVTRRCGP